MRHQKKKSIDDEMNHILTELGSMEVNSQEYHEAAQNLKVLCEAKNNTRSVSPDSIVLAITNILGIVLILNYEQLHVIPSKALGLILKGRL